MISPTEVVSAVLSVLYVWMAVGVFCGRGDIVFYSFPTPIATPQKLFFSVLLLLFFLVNYFGASRAFNLFAPFLPAFGEKSSTLFFSFGVSFFFCLLPFVF